MTHKLIKTENYLLVVDDSEIKKGDWIMWDNKVVIAVNTTYLPSTKKIIAHLPLNGSPIVEGIPLLPPIEDDVLKMAKDYLLEQGYSGFAEHGLVKNWMAEFYNKAKEKYKYTEEDVRKAIRMTTEIKGDGIDDMFFSDDEIIQSLHQYPTEFECEMYNTEEIKSVETDWIKVGRPTTITTAQGIQWVGKYK